MGALSASGAGRVILVPLGREAVAFWSVRLASTSTRYRMRDPKLRSNLPAQISNFIGREAELVEVRRLAAGSRLVTLTGTGGAGKTRLALQVAAELLDGAADGVWFADLASLGDPDRLSPTRCSAWHWLATAGPTRAGRPRCRRRRRHCLNGYRSA